MYDSTLYSLHLTLNIIVPDSEYLLSICMKIHLYVSPRDKIVTFATNFFKLMSRKQRFVGT